MKTPDRHTQSWVQQQAAIRLALKTQEQEDP